MSQNPYEKIYDELNIKISQQTTYQEAQQIAKHLGYLHNTFGIIIKDFINLIGWKFKSQTSNDLSNKDKKDQITIMRDLKEDKKNKLDNSISEQYLEGKLKITPPSRLIEEIKNFNKPGNIHLSQEQILKQKLLKLREEKNPPQNQVKQNDSAPINEEVANEKETLKRKISMKNKTDFVVINISSEDEQKEQNEGNGVRTRSRVRGPTGKFMRPQTLLQRGKNKKRGQKSSQSSRFGEGNSEQASEGQSKLKHYPLHPSDPFTIIYDVPYKGKSKNGNSSQSLSEELSKKQKKYEKRLSKYGSGQSSQNSDQLEKPSIKPLQKQPLNGTKQLGNGYKPSRYSKSFIDKVAIFIKQKKSIQEQLQNLEQEYEIQGLNENIIEKKQKSNTQIQQPVEDEYEMEEQLPHQDKEDQQNGQKLKDQEFQFEYEVEFIDKAQQEFNQAARKSNAIVSNEREKYLNQLNQSIQKQFEENLKMNQQNQEDEYENQVLLQSQQNQYPWAPEEIPREREELEMSEPNRSFDSYEKVGFDIISQHEHENNQNGVSQEKHQRDVTVQKEKMTDKADKQVSASQQQYYAASGQQQVYKQIKNYPIPIVQDKDLERLTPNKSRDQVLRVLEQFSSDSEQQVGQSNLISSSNSKSIILSPKYLPPCSLIGMKIGDLDLNKQALVNPAPQKQIPNPQISESKPENIIKLKQPSPNKSLSASQVIMNQNNGTSILKPQQQKKTLSQSFVFYPKKNKQIQVIDLE